MAFLHHIGENFERQILALVSNAVLEGLQDLGLDHVNTGLQNTPEKKSIIKIKKKVH